MKLTKPEQIESALRELAALPYGARLDGCYLAGGYWRATWAGNIGDGGGILIVTASWDEYRLVVHRALAILNRPKRKRAAAETTAANLRNSATA